MLPIATPSQATDSKSLSTVDVVVVGAGFSGLYLIHRLRALGVSFRVFEAGSDIGGTWYWNRYPGARCDVPGIEYSYSFSNELEQEWEWTERYATQPEILRYVDHVAKKFDLRRDIQFDTRVTSAVFDEATDRWTIETNKGDIVNAQFCIMATGCLSVPKDPELKGQDTFKGAVYLTSKWPHEQVDLTGKRVGIVGTGSSGVQAIPCLAKQASHLYVFQRTPNFVIPAMNRPLDREEIQAAKAKYAELRGLARAMPFAMALPISENSLKSALAVSSEEAQREFQTRYDYGGFSIFAAFADLILNKDSNDLAAEYVRSRIRERVRDPAVAEKLLPKDHPIGTKRPCMDTDYFETYNRDNVTLVDVRSHPIEEVTPTGLRLTGGDQYDLDVLVIAMGFDIVTGALDRIDIRGKGGLKLKEKWEKGPRTYLGLMSADFPNLFTVTGPLSPSVLTNMIMAIEQHVDWIVNCINHVRSHNFKSIEASVEAENGWVDHAKLVSDMTLCPLANSTYMGANVPGKPRVFLPYIGGFQNYSAKCADVVAKGYEGFVLKA